MKKIILTVLALTLVLISCNKEDNNLNDNLIEKLTLIHSETLSDQSKIQVFTDNANLESGYNTIYVQLKDDNDVEIENATIQFHPEMDMGTMQHGCPVIHPTYQSETGLYEGVSIFTMPSGDMGSWTFSIEINDETISFPIEIKETPNGTKHVGSYIGTDDNRYIVSLVKPFEPSVGMNDIKIMIHQSNMHDFIPVDNLTIEMDPQMTSMGHGSPNNVSPSFEGHGTYKGKVNFTMSGDWRINLDISDGDDVLIEAAYIDILF